MRSTATVTRIIDGDTFVADVAFSSDVLNASGAVRRRVRVIGINAPELHKPGGLEAKGALEALLSAGGIEVQVVKACDDFGRLLASVYSGDTDVGAAMIDGGHAVKFRGLALPGK